MLVAIVGAAIALRCVRLGSLSFAGDEETTTLAAVALLEGWPPTLPGGLVYLRGLPFTFLEAGMVALAGTGEWSLRLVPALCAAPRIVAMWWLARPLLGVPLALAAAGLLAVAPLDVEISRSARMYSLFVAFDLAFLGAVVHACIRGRHWGLAAGSGVFAVVTHTLAVTHAPVPWLAGLAHGLHARRRGALLALGVLVIVAYLVMQEVLAFSYGGLGLPAESPGERPGPLAGHANALLQLTASPARAALLAVAGLAALGLTGLAVRRLEGGWCSRAAAAASGLAFLLGSPVLGSAGLVGVIAFEPATWRLLLRRGAPLLLAAVIGTAGWFVASLVASGASAADAEAAVRMLLAFPAPNWFDFAELAPALFVLGALGAVVAARRAATGPHSGAWLVVVAAALSPLLMAGLMTRREGIRYHAHELAPLILLALIAAETFAGRFFRSRGAVVAATLIVAATLRPDFTVRAIVRDHGPTVSPFVGRPIAPDHRGAAEFVLANAAEGDWIAAEDALQQRLMIGRVDLWLRRFEDARKFLRADPAGGLPLDFYTGSRHVHDLDALRGLARAERQRVVWLVTSGESEASPHYFRTPETHRRLLEWRPMAWFTGRDGVTRVYQLLDGEVQAPP